MIVSYLEAYSYFSGGITVRDVVASPSNFTNYAYLWRLQNYTNVGYPQ